MRLLTGLVLTGTLAGPGPTALMVRGSTAVQADSTPKFVAPASVQELEERIRQVLDSMHVPGTGLAIVRHDSVVYAGGLGLARVDPAVPATAATLFRIGSTSKAFVAFTAMQLQEEGKLSIQDPIKTYLPDFWYRNAWEDTDPIRIVHLLEHTSGFDDNSLMTYANSDPTPLTLAEGLALDTTTRVSRWRPGTRFSYCNTGPAIVARIIEVIEGKPFEQVVQERLFDHIGMRTATYFFPDTTRNPMTSLYQANGRTPFPYWHVFIRPAGSINASANDMAQYVRFLLGRGTINDTALVQREDIERMERSETWIGARAGLSIGYGLHLYRTSDTSGFVWTQHDGGVEGGLSDMSYMPDAGVGYAMQINSANPAAFARIRTLIRAFLTRDLARPDEAPAVPVSATIRDEFAGWYRPVSPRVQHLYFLERIAGLTTVRAAGDTVVVHPFASPRVRLVAVDSLRFRRPGESVATVAFLRDATNDRPHGMEFDLGLPTSFRRVPTGQALAELGLGMAWCGALVLGLLALVLVPVRALVRRIRRQSLRASASRPLWRLAMLASVLIAIPLAAGAVYGAGIAQLGLPSPLSVSVYACGLLYLAVALFAAWLVVTVRRTESHSSAILLWGARAVLVLHVVGASYLTYWGLIGWKMWT